MDIAWNNIKKIGQSKIVSMTIFIPIFGYLIFFNDFIIDFIQKSTIFLENELISHNLNTVDNKLYFLYFGFSFLGIASILYKIFTPNLINEYLSLREYIKEEKELMTDKNIRDLCDKLIDLKVTDISILQNKIIPVEQIENSTIIEIMKVNWDYYNTKYLYIRYIIIFCYFVGFILVSIPSIKMFYKILIIFMNK